MKKYVRDEMSRYIYDLVPSVPIAILKSITGVRAGLNTAEREGVISFLEKRDPKWNLKVPGDMPDFFPLT